MAAVVASYIGYRNWRTAQNKLKMELFDRRMAVYSDLQLSLNARMARQWVPEEDQGHTCGG